MSIVLEKGVEIAELLEEDISVVNDVGLLNGKMGISIYFCHLGRKTKNPEYKKFAQKLIGEVYEEVNNNQPPIEFMAGLPGIAWGIEYLVQNNFVEADTDSILSKVDDKIYRYVMSVKQLSIGVKRGAMGFLLYIISRLEDKDVNVGDPNIFIHKRLLIHIVNNIGRLAEERKLTIQEPFLFDLTWDLPLCLLLLSKVRAMDFYNSKVDQILKCLSHPLLSIFPHSPSNRLYLLFALENVLQQIPIAGWSTHVKLLKKNICLTDILQKDLKNKNISFVNGMAGVSSISRRLYLLTNDENLCFKNEDLIRRIIFSEYWQIIENRKPERRNFGLLSGLAGIGMELLKLSKE